MMTLAHISGEAPSLLLDLPATSLLQCQCNNYIKDIVKWKTNPLAMAPPNTTCMLPPSPVNKEGHPLALPHSVCTR